MKTIILISSLCFCFSLSFAQNTWAEVDTTLFIDWDTFEIEPAFDVSGLTINILRKNSWTNYIDETNNSYSSFGTPTYGSSKRKVKLRHSSHFASKPSYGVNLGNGIFLNYTGEILFFVPSWWDLDYQTGFKIQSADEKNHTHTHIVENNQYQVNSSRRFRRRRELLTANWDSTFQKVEIYFGKALYNSISIDEKDLKVIDEEIHGSVKFDSKTNKYTLSKIYGKDDSDEKKLTKKNAKELVLNKGMHLRIEDKVLKIGNNCRIFRTENDIYILRGEELSIRINLTNKQADIYEFGKLQSSFFKL